MYEARHHSFLACNVPTPRRMPKMPPVTDGEMHQYKTTPNAESEQESASKHEYDG